MGWPRQAFIPDVNMGIYNKHKKYVPFNQVIKDSAWNILAFYI
jgi:hypothetical protein